MLKNVLGFLVIAFLIYTALTCSSKTEPVFQGSEADATSFASQVAPKLMAKYYPNTGTNPGYIVHDWQFDRDEHQYTIDMSGYWTGQSCMLCDDACRAEVRGTLTIGENGGNYRFEITGINDCVRQHNMTGLVIGTVLDMATSGDN